MKPEQSLLGTWLVESYSHDGREDRRYRGMKVVFGPGAVTFHRPTAGTAEAAHTEAAHTEAAHTGAGYAVDPAGVPAAIDFYAAGTAEPACLGVYRLEGDRLTICHADETVLASGTGRPGGFACPAGSGLRLWELRRPEAAG